MSTSNKLVITCDYLPPSNNEYLHPSSRMQGSRRVHYMFETLKSRDFKLKFQADLKRQLKNQDWSIEDTKDGHWHLDCYFVQSRINQDNSNYYKILLDAMTGIAINDDKNVLPRTMRVFYDSKNPRFTISLYKTDSVGVFSDEDHYNEFFSNNCAMCTKKISSCSFLKAALESRLNEEAIPSSKGFSECLKIRRKAE